MQSIKSMLPRRAVVLPAATALGVLGMTGVASAATYNVNDPGDYSLATPGDTNCASTNGGSCTLRAAVQAADNTGLANTINVPAGTYDLTKNALGVNSPDKGTSITVNGAGSASTIINAQDYSNIFNLDVNGTLVLNGLTLENGYQGDGDGGAIYSDGALTLNNDVLTGNGTSSYGGAIYASSVGGSSLAIAGTTFSGNGGDCSGCRGVRDRWVVLGEAGESIEDVVALFSCGGEVGA
jgi:large repetitive protein